MGKFKVGDRIIVTAGAFKGERGAIVRKIRIGQGLRVALERKGREIKTKEDDVSLAD